MYICSVYFLFGSVSSIRAAWPLGTPSRFIVDYGCVFLFRHLFRCPGLGDYVMIANTLVLNH